MESSHLSIVVRAENYADDDHSIHYQMVEIGTKDPSFLLPELLLYNYPLSYLCNGYKYIHISVFSQKYLIDNFMEKM